MVNRRTRGIFEILLSGVFFGFLGVLGKSFYSSGGTPGELLSLRFLFSGTLLWTFWLAREPRALLIGRRAVFRCGILGVFGYAIFSSCFFQALTGLSASLTVLLLYLYPVIVAVGAWGLFGEKIRRERLAALPIALAGLLALVWGDFEISRQSALLFGIGSAVFYALYILASSRWLVGVNPLVSVTYIQTAAGGVLAAIYLRDATHVVALMQKTWLILALVAVVSSLLAMSLFLAGLQKLKSWEASVLSLAEPLTGVIAAMVLLGDRLSGLQMVGAAAVIAALVFVSWPHSRESFGPMRP
jgi:DME family drug/metabolite transporter